MVCKSTKDLENKVIDEFENIMYDTQNLSQRASMSSRNGLINEKNFKFMEKIPGEIKIG